MSLSPAYQAALDRLREAGIASADPTSASLEQARAVQQRYFGFLAQDPPALADVREHAFAGPAGTVRLRSYHPEASSGLPVIVFVRGAGWWAGDLDSHDRTARLCALGSGLPVLSVDYHCAPESNFPVQRDEVTATVQWLNSQGSAIDVDGQSVILWGESAGASLSVLATSRLLQQGNGSVKGLILLYGNFEGPTERTRAYSKWVWTQYLGTPWEQVAPDAVPLRCRVDGFPTAWLGVGDEDPLLRDTLLMEAALREHGVGTTLRRYPGLPHGFATMSKVFPEAVDIIDEAAAHARRMAGVA
ncbi:MAG: alpha/beta hydrolase [Pseudomonadota bacterium]